ncbi:MAG: hypothetical protein EXS24_06980 [Pedosphaera sp.]|nr:hypothetical protein [Pedosphaera sp.]
MNSTPTPPSENSPELQPAASPNSDHLQRYGIFVFGLAIFLGAFLLFQVQPLIGKYILPWFGGSAGVWTTCLLFFQVFLFAGYAYAHWLSGLKSLKTQTLIHAGLILLAVCTLPIRPSESLKPTPDGDPIWQILKLLLFSLGLPYLALAATGPLLQSWFSRVYPGKSPYRLYSLSNIGSLLPLITFPFLVEPFMTRTEQVNAWSIGKVCFALVILFVAWMSARHQSSPEIKTPLSPTPSSTGGNPPKDWQRLLWLLLPACGTALFMSTTNKICQDVAVVPFLWILPLALYLLTFIICFDSPRWYSRHIYLVLLGLSWAAGCFALFRGVELDIVPQLASYSAALFFGCMVCHGELYQLRPGTSHLTQYYLFLSGGGALGGLCVAVGAPLLFKGYWEFSASIVANAILLVLVTLLASSYWRVRRGTVGVLMAICWGVLCWALFRGTEMALWKQVLVGAAAFIGGCLSAGVIRNLYRDWLPNTLACEGAAALTGATITAAIWAAASLSIGEFESQWKWIIVAWLVLSAISFVWVSLSRWYGFGLSSTWPAAVMAIAVLAALWSHHKEEESDGIFKSRNFYGTLKIKEYSVDDPDWHYLLLLNGKITHGLEYTHPDWRGKPTSYYATNSGAGVAILNSQDAGKRVGVVGLGTGTLAGYGKKGDYYCFYEINPQVKWVAENKFNYLKLCEATNEVVLGDARLSMELDSDKNFDVLILDAFSSDAIPVHLLTKESFDLYKKLLKPDGVLVVHISNRFLNLEPVVEKLAKYMDWRAVVVDNSENGRFYASTWVIITKNKAVLSAADEADGRLANGSDRVKLWTDDYASIYPILKGNPLETLPDKFDKLRKRLFSWASPTDKPAPSPATP